MEVSQGTTNAGGWVTLPHNARNQRWHKCRRLGHIATQCKEPEVAQMQEVGSHCHTMQGTRGGTKLMQEVGPHCHTMQGTRGGTNAGGWATLPHNARNQRWHKCRRLGHIATQCKEPEVPQMQVTCINNMRAELYISLLPTNSLVWGSLRLALARPNHAWSRRSCGMLPEKE